MTPSRTVSGSTRHAPLAIKVCGLRTAEHLQWVGQSGATLAGFVFAASRRRVTVAEAQAALASPAGGRMGSSPEIVGVFADQDEGEVAAIAAACPLRIVQLSGRESPRVTADLVARGLRVIKTVHVEEGMTAAAALRAITPHVEAGAEAILLDSASRQGGGSGKVFDWAVAREVSSRGLAPVLLAGGLSPTNVAAAVATVHPWGVDVSSGVETDGIKDRAKIHAFVGAARAGSTPAAARQPREF